LIYINPGAATFATSVAYCSAPKALGLEIPPKLIIADEVIK
jgi:hypothetical protein